MLERHKAVFDGGLGKLKGYQAKIYVDPGAQPRFCKARTVPYAMRRLVEEELQRLEKEGIIDDVPFADWAVPIVPVLKSDKKSLRLCGDFKLTVNKALKLDKYLIPKIEDLFSKLTGGKSFSKSQAYQQLMLDEESRKYVVINTPSSNGLAERAVQVFKQGDQRYPESELLGCCSATGTHLIRTTTGMTPAELLVGRKPRSRLDLLRANIEQRVQSRQERQQADHDKHSRSRVFSNGESVYVENHRRSGEKWLPREIVEMTGPVSFRVQMTDGSVVRSHQDHLRKRPDGTGQLAESRGVEEFSDSDRWGATPIGTPPVVSSPPAVVTPPAVVPPSETAREPESEPAQDIQVGSSSRGAFNNFRPITGSQAP